MEPGVAKLRGSRTAELRAALGVSALLRRRPADMAAFRRLVSGSGPFASITGLCLLLADGDGAMAARDFVGTLAPMLLQQLRRETRVERVVMHGRTRGRVDWSATYKERYATDNNPALFVCRPGWRQYDLPENQLVKATLLALQRALVAVPPDLGTWHAWGSGAPRDRNGTTPTIEEALDPLRFQLKKLLGMMVLREVAEPSAIDPRHLAAARGSKNELYGLVAAFHEYASDVVGGKDWDRWARVVGAILPLLPGDPVFTRVGQLADPPQGGHMTATPMRANGILAETGDYGLETTVEEVYQAILAERKHRTSAEAAVEVTNQTKGTQGLADERDLEEARWALIIPDPVTPAVQAHLDHLKPLIALRATQMKAEPPIFKCPPGLRFDTFVSQVAKLQFGDFDPVKLPYYLCVVAPPDDPALGWAFQQNLDAPYAVGRIWFDDPLDCKAYVDKLVARETAAAKSNMAALFVAPVFPNDGATASSHAEFVLPLRAWADSQAWSKGVVLDLMDPDPANFSAQRKNIANRMSANRPALLFAASHGVERKLADPVDQGALLLQDWPGLKNPILPGHFLSEADLPASLDGMMAFCFACYSAGAPRYPDWIHPSANPHPDPVAAKPFVARLPQKMLARGAPAFIGHVSKVWDWSFLSIDKIDGAYLGTLSAYKSALRYLLTGYPVGHATDALNGRWLTLTQLLDDAIDHGAPQSDVVNRWKARNDCRGYVVLGDPFAHLIV